MLKNILSISGRPGLYRLVSRGKNMLIVEAVATGKRTPAYAHDKVISLGDISIYTEDGEDTLLSNVLESLRQKTEGNAVDIKALGDDAQIREFFGEVLPEFDRERVYTTDIKKLLSWYNILIGAGITDFATDTEATEETAETKE